ncbi:uncharacterized protein LOC117340871 [Pecten maximus]|uniref:uncharacterized protein LOC117340871 n=1 Tax=Pecten maximus TaxID=6579 RepID=UPI001458F1F0|nr:uncharacterized protein LOC117340871 [Pecten maximus]
MMMKWTLRVMSPCLLLVALCSSLPVRSSLRDKSTKYMLKQRRTEGENPQDPQDGYIPLIAMAIKGFDDNHDDMIDEDELENMFLTMNSNINMDTAHYLTGVVFDKKEFQYNDGQLPILGLATFFSRNDIGIF